MPFAENLGTGGGTLDAQYGSVPAANTNAPLLLAHAGTNYLYLPGVVGNSAKFSTASTVTGNVWRVTAAIDSTTAPAYIFSSGSGTGVSETGLYGNSGVRLSWLDSTSTSVTSVTNAVPFPIGAYWIRGTVNATTTTVALTWETAPYTGQTSPPIAGWTTIRSATQVVANAGVVASASQRTIGARNWTTSGVFDSKMFRVIEEVDSTVVSDVDFRSGITSGNQTTFTESSTNAATVTIVRGASGRKAVAVVEPVWLLGTDDFFEVPDSDLLDFGPTDSFTVLASVRQWATPTSAARFVHKGGATGPVWRTGNYFATTTPNSSLLDAAAVNVQTITPAGPAAGTTAIYAMVVDRTAQTMTTFVDGVAGTPASIAGVGSVASASVMRIGATSLGAAFLSGEVSGVLVIRRALSAAEVGVIAGYYAQAPTIITQPVNVTKFDGQTATFTVAVAGDPVPALQWERSTDGGLTFAPIVGATSSVLNVTGLQVAWSGYRYRCVATNIGGSVTSSAAVLTVNAIVLTNASSDVTAGGYRVVTWTSSGSIAVAGAPLDVEHLVVAGGGGGGGATSSQRGGGGGGAGGLLTNVGGTALTLAAATHTITVGAGGVGGVGVSSGATNPGSNGSNSSIAALVVATGGGGGGGGFSNTAGLNGGSGGGAGANSTSGPHAGGTGISGQGNKGGDAATGTDASASGGGAGGVGVDGSAAAGGYDKTGGAGLTNSITGLTYAVGGNGNKDVNDGAPAPGTNGRGNGGQGAGRNGAGGGFSGGRGGDGIVIVRWAV